MIPIFDGHNDAVCRLREYTPDGIDFLARNTTGHLDLPRAREGGLFGGFFATFTWPDPSDKRETLRTPEGYEVPMASAVETARASQEITRQLDALRALSARSNGSIRIATSATAIEQARDENAFAMVLHTEGAEAIGLDLSELPALYNRGLRSLGLVWSRPNLFGHGVPFAYPRSPDTGPGLTPAGRELVHACNRLGVMIDLAHLNEAGFWNVAALSSAPLVATHTCVHALCPSARNLTDRQLDAIREADGIVGVNFSVPDVRPDGHRDPNIPLAILVQHFLYLANRIGIDRVAIGSDFDGATIPSPIGDANGLQRLVEALRDAGFDEPSLRKVAHENWLRVLKHTLGS